MGLVIGTTLPNDGDRIKAINYNDPIQKILAQLNGNLDGTNILSLPGSKITNGSIPVTAFDSSVAAGWVPSSDALTFGANNGAREFTVTIANADKTSVYSKGMRTRITRSTTPATKSMAFIAASSQSATKSSPSNLAFTSAFTVSAWVKLNSFTGGNQTIISRADSPFQNGWFLRIDTNGSVAIGYASANTSTVLTSYQAMPLNRWVHIAGVITSVSSKTGLIYYDGALIPSRITTSNSTALTQAGDLAIGKLGGTSSDYFDGSISEVHVWGSALSQSQIQGYMAQNAAGTEGMAGLWRGDNNFNDLTTNANSLTANNGAVASQVANPFSSMEYGIITNVSYSSPNTTLTIFTGTDCTIPNGSLSSFSYSTARAPYGFPANRAKWKVNALYRTLITQASASSGTWYNAGHQLSVPTGEWNLRWAGIMYSANGSSSPDIYVTVSDANNFESEHELTVYGYFSTTNATLEQYGSAQKNSILASQAVKYLNFKTSKSGLPAIGIDGSAGHVAIEAECSYL